MDIEKVMTNTELIREFLEKKTDKELLEFYKVNWSDYASALNQGYCNQCDALSNACGLFCPCQYDAVAENMLKEKGIEY